MFISKSLKVTVMMVNHRLDSASAKTIRNQQVTALAVLVLYKENQCLWHHEQALRVFLSLHTAISAYLTAVNLPRKQSKPGRP